ncbi:MAG: AraC family transcriptional regulator [Clostridia bacterium]|nr:AraC family transcriptional regulator [Clostridia bacterium]
MFNFVYKQMDFAHKLDSTALPTDDFKKHMHDHYELLMLVDGVIDYTVESETRRLQHGEILIVKPGDLHFGTVDLSTPYERYVLKFSADMLPDWLLKKLNTCPTFGNRLSVNSYKVFEEFDDIYGDSTDEDTDERYMLMYGLLIKILVDIYKYNDRRTSDHLSSKNVFIDKITGYINDNITKTITLEEICHELHYSKSYISSEFSKELKTPIMTYIKYKKIIAAHKEIMEGCEKTAEIAEKYGFKEYSTFYRNYIRIIGHPPLSDKH